MSVTRVVAAFVIIMALMLSGCVYFRGPYIHFHKTTPRETAVSESETGVILLAHGSGKEWNAAVADAFAKTGGAYKKELVFGMGSARDIQKSIDRLEASGARAIVVVPLFLSSHSEMYRHLEYILGLREEPDVLFMLLMGRHATANSDGHSGHGSSDAMLDRVRFSVPYRMASPVNYDSVIAEILTDRLRGIVAGSSVFLISHGPITAEDDLEWHRDLLQYVQYLSRAFPGSRFFGMTFRDDAPPFIRDNAVRKIQDAMRREIILGRRVVVFPFLLASGGRESEVGTIMRDCGECVMIPLTLLPHPAMARYIAEKIENERMLIFSAR